MLRCAIAGAIKRLTGHSLHSHRLCENEGCAQTFSGASMQVSDQRRSADGPWNGVHPRSPSRVLYARSRLECSMHVRIPVSRTFRYVVVYCKDLCTFLLKGFSALFLPRARSRQRSEEVCIAAFPYEGLGSLAPLIPCARSRLRIRIYVRVNNSCKHIRKSGTFCLKDVPASFHAHTSPCQSCWRSYCAARIVLRES